MVLLSLVFDSFFFTLLSEHIEFIMTRDENGYVPMAHDLNGKKKMIGNLWPPGNKFIEHLLVE